MDLGITGKTALIGASSDGLGKAVAKMLASEGVNVVICGRTQATLEEAEAEIRAVTRGEILAQTCDVTSEDDRKALLSAALAKFGAIDILVTNSGGPPAGKFEDHDAAAWQAAFDLLLQSAVGLINGVLPGMKKKGWGRIIAITSQAVKQPVENLVLSNSVRASVVGLVRTLANELGEYGVTVNNVMPGFTRTKRLEKLMETTPAFRTITNEIPLGRIGEPDEFAAMVTFLASQQASYITGVSVPVDGGWIKALL